MFFPLFFNKTLIYFCMQLSSQLFTKYTYIDIIGSRYMRQTWSQSRHKLKHSVTKYSNKNNAKYKRK